MDEQLNAQLLFEHLDLVGEDRPGHQQHAGRRAEMQRLGERHEAFDLPQFYGRAFMVVSGRAGMID